MGCKTSSEAAGTVSCFLLSSKPLGESPCVPAAGGPSAKDSVKGNGNAGISNGGAGAILL